MNPNLKKSILLLFLTMTLVVTPKSQASSFANENFKVIVGGQTKSLLMKRGIVTYEGFQAAPIIGVQLFHPDWLLTASTLYYNRFISEHWIVRSRLNFNATEDDPLFVTSESKDARVRREKTTEWDLFLEYRWHDQSFVRWQYSQDLVAHKGYHTELMARFSVYDFLKKANGLPLIQPGLFAKLGFGNSTHNQYLYGDGADTASTNFTEYGLWLASPSVIDPFWPTLTVSKFQILGEGNKSAAYVEEQEGWQATLLFAFQIW